MNERQRNDIEDSGQRIHDERPFVLPNVKLGSSRGSRTFAKIIPMTITATDSSWAQGTTMARRIMRISRNRFGQRMHASRQNRVTQGPKGRSPIRA